MLFYKNRTGAGAPALFDFAEPWKIDIIDFLNNNYMYDLSMEEIASYTGRSLAVFERDFKKAGPLSPQKWRMFLIRFF